jgi:predicted O-methyltransferase YrrM
MSAAEVYAAHTSGGIWSDIKKHLPTLRLYAKGNVFEIGVRGGISTAALLEGVAEEGGHVWSLDINDCSGLYRDDPHWTFIKGHSVEDSARILAALPRPLDMLFIDSEHSYKLTGDELHIYGPLVRQHHKGAILMHDTDLAGAGVRRALDEYAAEIGVKPFYVDGDNGLGVLVP